MCRCKLLTWFMRVSALSMRFCRLVKSAFAVAAAWVSVSIFGKVMCLQKQKRFGGLLEIKAAGPPFVTR